MYQRIKNENICRYVCKVSFAQKGCRREIQTFTEERCFKLTPNIIIPIANRRKEFKMNEERNQNQIIRKDARNCFVESLSDSFAIERIHLVFATYDVSKPVGQRQTNNIHIYIAVDEFLELCRKLSCGELRYMLQAKRDNRDSTPLFQSLGGTSAQKLAEQGRSRADGKSMSRTVQLLCGSKSDFLFVADSGPGDTTEKGLIVPKFVSKPENHVAVSMTFEALSGLLLMTKAHYEAWLVSYYLQRKPIEKNNGSKNPTPAKECAEDPSFNKFIPGEMF